VTAIVEAKLKEVATVCAKRGVRRLALFGSGARDHFRRGESDLDILVEFGPMVPTERAEAYFGLLEDLEALFGVGVDLVESHAIRNPFFRQEVDQTQVVLYEAA